MYINIKQHAVRVRGIGKLDVERGVVSRVKPERSGGWREWGRVIKHKDQKISPFYSRFFDVMHV